MSADVLLSQLENVKRTGDGRWIARCPAHEDRRASLTVRELGDGRVLAHCFAGCSITEVLGAVGLDMTALFPEKNIVDGKPERRPFPAADILRAVSFETLIVSLAAAQLVKGKPLVGDDLERLKLAASRLHAAAEEYNR
ncbi:MAG: DNA primase [Hydrogenophilales bacterium 16-64-46]|nr:MAG: DNA primase [Hydrogenophilales bacterium 12-64-13]OYZ04019.1 MAG: DNA primase [Hydrogenophilales bacterium 16-64-46]OZA36657.1 MAG: DNA primase [Hydrogenophilales bacterium 17-64-34]HQT01148.1 DNA primase [Thiobacillus sp.]